LVLSQKRQEEKKKKKKNKEKIQKKRKTKQNKTNIEKHCFLWSGGGRPSNAVRLWKMKCETQDVEENWLHPLQTFPTLDDAIFSIQGFYLFTLQIQTQIHHQINTCSFFSQPI
jgi:hypothetical protein